MDASAQEHVSAIAAESDARGRPEREAVRLLYRRGPTQILGALLCATVLASFLWWRSGESLLLVWWLALFGTSAWRLSVILRERRTGRSQDPGEEAGECAGTGARGRRFVRGALVAGVLWGGLPLLLVPPGDLEALLVVSCVYAAMLAVSASSSALHLPAFRAFSLPLVLPLSVSQLLSGEVVLQVTGVLLGCFLLVNIRLARGAHRDAMELIRARFDNRDLVSRLARENERVERALAAKNRFLAAASHDLRQPLQAMRLLVASLRERDSDPARLRILGELALARDALNRMFDSVLDLSRLEADIVEIESRRVPLDPLFANLRNAFAATAADRGLLLSVDARGLAVRSDRILLERILLNLLANALHHTRAGEVLLRARRRGANEVDLIVGDSGPGLPEAALASLRGRRDALSEGGTAHSAEHVGSATDAGERDEGHAGLGLAIVGRLCRALDIGLRVQVEAGAGTRFILSCAADVDGIAEQTPMRAGGVAVTPAPGESATPAVAGPRPLLLLGPAPEDPSLERQLVALGFRVLHASRLQGALRVFAMHEPPPRHVLLTVESQVASAMIATLREHFGPDIAAARVAAPAPGGQRVGVPRGEAGAVDRLAVEAEGLHVLPERPDHAALEAWLDSTLQARSTTSMMARGDG